jgi:hypothetical protein
MEWPATLIEAFQTCDIVETQRRPETARKLPVEIGDAS